MKIKRFATSALIAATLAYAGVAQAQPAAGADWTARFDELVGAAKQAMVADPSTAFARSGEAFKLAAQAPASEARTLKLVTAQWLEGEALLQLNRYAEAGPLFAHALEGVETAQPGGVLHGRLLMGRATVLASEGRLDAALADLRAAQTMLAASGERRVQAMALQIIGSIYQDAGHYPQVLRCYAKAAEVYPSDPVLLATAHNNRGDALKAMGRYDEAEQAYGQALEISRELDSPVFTARILSNLASAQMWAGRLDAAEATLGRALNVTETDPGAREWRRYILGVAGQAALKRGNPRAAAQLLGRMFEGVDPTTTSALDREFHEAAYRAFSRTGHSGAAAPHQRAVERLALSVRRLAEASGDACATAPPARQALALLSPRD